MTTPMFPLIKKAAIVLFGFSILMTANLASADDQKFTKAQKEEINRMIRGYILEHPEILPEAIQILQDRQKKMLLEKNETGLYKDGYSFVGGDTNGEVTLVEFFDYNCSVCKRTLATMEKLKKDVPGLRVIYKEFPILMESSVIAAKAAMASQKQGKYAEFHKAMMLNLGNLTEDRIFEIAREVGLDDKLMAIDMALPDLNIRLQKNHTLAQTLGITGTPGFVVGETILSGALPYPEMVKIIETARETIRATKSQKKSK